MVRVTLTMRMPASDTSTLGRQKIAQQQVMNSATHGSVNKVSVDPERAATTTRLTTQLHPSTTVRPRPKPGRNTSRTSPSWQTRSDIRPRTGATV